MLNLDASTRSVFDGYPMYVGIGALLTILMFTFMGLVFKGSPNNKLILAWTVPVAAGALIVFAFLVTGGTLRIVDKDQLQNAAVAGVEKTYDADVTYIYVRPDSRVGYAMHVTTGKTNTECRFDVVKQYDAQGRIDANLACDTPLPQR